MREPINRFAAALIEILRRIFKGVCPAGPCDGPRDFYFTSGMDDSADNLARYTSWYRHALRLHRGDVSGADRPQVLRELLTAVVTDTSCLLDYYGAEHFMTQMQLASQGTPLDAALPAEQVRLVRLGDVGRSADELALGDFLRAIGADAVTRAELERCHSYANAHAHNKAVDDTPEVAALSSSDAQRFARLPTEAEVEAVVREEHALLISLCHTYAQDMVCMSEHYAPPAVCRGLLSA